MSRTYRRKKAVKHSKAGFWRYSYLPEITYESWNRPFVVRYFSEWYDHYPSEKEKSKARKLFQADGGTWSYKEPGPSWFRNKFETRPTRQKNKNEIRKFMLNEDYEPMVVKKGKLPYWT